MGEEPPPHALMRVILIQLQNNCHLSKNTWRDGAGGGSWSGESTTAPPFVLGAFWGGRVGVASPLASSSPSSQ